jgi:hypothetical protein
VEVEQIPEQRRLVEEIAELLLLPPCIVGSIARMLHSRHKPRMGLDRRNTGHIEQHSQLQPADCRHRVLMGL